MLIKAKQKFIRQSPRKVRLVADSIRGLSLEDAQHQLSAIRKFAAEPLKKTLNQAIANATNNHQIPKEQLNIKEIQIGEGQTYKRWRPVSRGRAHTIFKRTSHITIILQSQEQSPPQPPSAKQKTPTSSQSKPLPKTRSKRSKPIQKSNTKKLETSKITK